MTKGNASKTVGAGVYMNDIGSVCLAFERQATKVKFITVTVYSPVDVSESSAAEFDAGHRPIDDYPAGKAARLIASFAKQLGASDAALDALRKFVDLKPQEIEMAKNATTKKQSAKAAPAKPAAAKASKPAAAKASKPAAAKASKPAAEKSKDKAPSAAQMFQDLIMEGKLTDDQIFAKVKERFGLDDKKRGYVGWYRNNLKKRGMNPPAAKS